MRLFCPINVLESLQVASEKVFYFNIMSRDNSNSSTIISWIWDGFTRQCYLFPWIFISRDASHLSFQMLDCHGMRINQLSQIWNVIFKTFNNTYRTLQRYLRYMLASIRFGFPPIDLVLIVSGDREVERIYLF